jgi:Na+-driven multidrug efflux pump
MLGELSFSTSRMLITPIVAGFGTFVVAAYGVALQLFAFGIMMLVGLALGLSSLIGHNIGAGKLERAKSTADRAILLGVGLMSTLGLLAFWFAEPFMGIFFDNPETILHGVEILRIWAIGFPFFGAFIMLQEIHMGVGHNTPQMIVVTIHSWGLQVLPAIIATQLLGLNQVAVWWILALSGAVSTFGFYLYYRRGAWLRHQV